LLTVKIWLECVLQEIAKDEEEIRELRASIKELKGQLKGCKGGNQTVGRKGIGRHLARVAAGRVEVQ
jgi:hypothetical protein